MNIYAGNLPYTLSESDLKDLFSPFGEVTNVKIIKDNYSNQSKGFGFVEMANVSDGQRAIKELNETTLQDRKIIVNEARPPSQEQAAAEAITEAEAEAEAGETSAVNFPLAPFPGQSISIPCQGYVHSVIRMVRL